MKARGYDSRWELRKAAAFTGTYYVLVEVALRNIQNTHSLIVYSHKWYHLNMYLVCCIRILIRTTGILVIACIRAAICCMRVYAACTGFSYLLPPCNTVIISINWLPLHVIQGASAGVASAFPHPPGKAALPFFEASSCGNSQANVDKGSCHHTSDVQLILTRNAHLSLATDTLDDFGGLVPRFLFPISES